MNLLVKRIGLLSTVALLFFFACKDPGLIGVDVSDDLGRFQTRFAEFDIPLKTIVAPPYQMTGIRTRIDTFFTVDGSDTTMVIDTITQYLSVNSGFLFGRLNSDTLGTATSKGYTNIGLPSLQPDIDSGHEFDSLVFKIQVTQHTGKELENGMTFNIYELTEGIDSANFSDTQYAFDPTPIATSTIVPDVDSLREAPTRFDYHIHFTEAFGQKIFEAARDDTTAFSSNANFKEFFKGMVFIPEGTPDLMLLPNVSASTFILYYHDESDTTFYAFNTLQSLYCHEITYDRTGTELEKITEVNTPTTLDDSIFYGQSGNLIPVIDLGQVRSLLDSFENVLVSRAEIEIEFPASGVFNNPPVEFSAFKFGNGDYDFADYPLASLQGSVVRLPGDGFRNFWISVSEFEEGKSGKYGIPGESFFRFSDGVIQNIILDPEAETEYYLVPSGFSSSANYLGADLNSVKLKVFYSTITE